MSAPQHYLVSFEGVSARVGGDDISSIAEFQLTAVANGIPAITLLVDAGHPEAGSPKAADAMTLSTASNVIRKYRSMVKKDGSTLSLSITVKSHAGGQSEMQRIDISGWMLTDVSMSPIQESGVCLVALTFMHPICKSHFGGSVPGLLAKPMTYEGLEGNNPLEVFISALRVYADAARENQPRETYLDGASDSTAVRDALIEKLGKATDDLDAAVTWTGGGLPAEAQLAEWGEFHRMGLAVYAMPSCGGSVFQRLSQLMIPECSLALGGDFMTSKLDIGPFKPWAAPTMTIKDSDIVSLQFPQNDPSPLSGVKLTSNDTSDTIPISFHIDMSQMETQPADIFYVPQSELSAEYMYGPIHQFNEPGWISYMRSNELSYSDGSKTDTASVKAKNLNMATTVPRNGKIQFHESKKQGPSIDYSSAMLACAKAYYETSLMKDWSFTVNTRLMFKSGGTICPGRVISVSSGSGTALAGYVTAVTHTISVISRAAHTSIVCTHPRFGEAPNGIQADNALYK